MAAPASQTFIALGGQWFTVYTFAKAGDEIPIHKHDDLIHLSFVVQGEFSVSDETGKGITLKQLDRVQYEKGRWHLIRSLTDGAIILNVNEKPNGS